MKKIAVLLSALIITGCLKNNTFRGMKDNQTFVSTNNPSMEFTLPEGWKYLSLGKDRKFSEYESRFSGTVVKNDYHALYKKSENNVIDEMIFFHFMYASGNSEWHYAKDSNSEELYALKKMRIKGDYYQTSYSFYNTQPEFIWWLRDKKIYISNCYIQKNYERIFSPRKKHKIVVSVMKLTSCIDDWHKSDTEERRLFSEEADKLVIHMMTKQPKIAQQ